MAKQRRSQSQGKRKSNSPQSSQKSKRRGGPTTTSSRNRDKKENGTNKSTLPSTPLNHHLTVKNTKSTPPWQIMSKKDMTKHAQELKIRREKIKAGEMPDLLHTPVTTTSYSTDSSASNRLLSQVDRELFSWKKFNPSKDVGGLVFVGSYLNTRKPPRLGVPEVAFLGRSNVGKSSLLNKLVSMASSGGGSESGGSTSSSSSGDDRARVGKTPGATASVNLYALLGKTKSKISTVKTKKTAGNDRSSGGKPVLGLVDLPGFGYAKLSKDVKESVELAAERYLNKRKELALGVLLLDARRVPSPDDRAVLDALYDMGLPLVIVVTKIDKIKKAAEAERQLESIARELDLPGPPLVVSGVTGEGVRDLWRIILDACRIRINEIKGAGENDDKESEEGFDILPRLGDDDEDDIEYDQGYDWNSNDSGYGDNVIEDEYDDEYDNEMEEEDFDEEDDLPSSDHMNLKSLKKRARLMERSGEV